VARASRTPLTITARAALACLGAIASVAGWSAPARAAASTLSCPKTLDKWKIVKAEGPDDASGWRTLDCEYHAVYDHSASYLLVTWSVSGDSIPRNACGTKEAPSNVPSVGGGETLASQKRRAAVLIGWQLLDESPAMEAAARGHAATLLARAEAEAQPCPSAKDAKPTPTAASPADTAPGTTDTPQSSSGWDPIKALSFVGGIGALGAGATALVRRRPRRPARSDGAPAPGTIVDGPAAIAMLHGQGWISPVTRGDGSIGWKPTGDLAQYVSFDHGGWQPAFSAGTTTPAGDAVQQLVGVAFTPGPDGLIDTITVVASSPPPAPPPAPIPDAALPSPAVPAATPPMRASVDPGSKMLLERSGDFLDFEGDAGALALPFALPGIVDTLAGVPPTASQDVPAVAASKPAPSPAPPLPAPAATPSGPFAPLLGRTGGSLAIGATDLHRVAPNWISADGAIAVGPFAGVHPTVTLGPGTIELSVTPYHATAQLIERNGRIFVTEPSVKGPMADFLDTKDIRETVQAHLDHALNGPIAAHGLHVTGTTVAPDGIHITTGPTAP
jgi:hypothetical protein